MNKKIIKASEITKTVSSLCIQANTVLRKDVFAALKKAIGVERNLRAKKLLELIIKNADIARKKKIAICQDTGLPLVFLKIGQSAFIQGDLIKAVQRGVDIGYKKGALRSSIVKDPLRRTTPKNIPAVIHTEITQGSKIKITVLPKGFGSENKTCLKMFNPTAGLDQIKDFVVKSVREAGPEACPPFVLGIGIGGSADVATLLAKKALLKKITPLKTKLTKDILKAVNATGIGVMGLGGKTTCLGVNIETYPTHIAGLPVAVNISCHALRSASKTI